MPDALVHRHAQSHGRRARSWREALIRATAGFPLLAIGVCLPQVLHAQSQAFDGTVALSSQLVDRGLAITPVTPILQGAVSWTSPSGWSLGLSGSTEVRSPDHLSEAFAQVSHYWPLSTDWQLQAGVVYYDYPSNTRSQAFDRAEAGLDWVYRDVLTFGLSAIYAVGSGDHRPRGAADVDFHWPLPYHFALSAGAGITQTMPYVYSYGSAGSYAYSHAQTYGYGHAGLAWGRGPWRVELDRIVTSLSESQHGSELAASPWVATISWSF